MDTGRANGTGHGVPVGEAAAALGLTTTAVRKRIKRGSLQATKSEDGTWLVYLADTPHGQSTGTPSDSPPDSPKRDDRVAILKQENERLWRELERRSEELRRKDVLLAEFSHRLADITQRLPELPSHVSEAPQPSIPPEKDKYPWWQFWKVS